MAWWLYIASDPFESLMKWEMLYILFKTFLARSQWKPAKLCLTSSSSLRPRRHCYEIWHWEVLLKFIIKLALVTSHNYEHLHENQMLLRACETYFQQMWGRKIKQILWSTNFFRDFTVFGIILKKLSKPIHSLTTLVSGWYLPPFK
jgi:hypothetical protein